MNASRNRFRGNDTGNPADPRGDPGRGATSLGFYHDTLSNGPDSRPHIGFLDTTFENEHESATHTSSSLSPIDPRNPGEEPLTTKPSTAEEKTKKFPKFKFSLTAPPPKSKPKQPGQGPPAVHVGGRGGAGNIKRLKPAATPASEGSDNQERKAVLVPVDSSRAHQPYPEGETSPEHESPGEAAAPWMKNGRGGASNLYNHVLEVGEAQRAATQEYELIRQRREMQAENIARWTGRGAVGNIKRSDDDTDQEYSTSSQSGNLGPRDFGSRRRGGTDIQPSIAEHPSSHPPRAPFPGQTFGPLSPGLNQEDADVLVARGYDAHIGRSGSLRRTNAGHPIPPGAMAGNIRPGEQPGRTRRGTVPRPRLVIPQDAGPPSYQNGDDPFVAIPNTLGAMARSRPHDVPGLEETPNNEPDGYYPLHGSRMSPPKDTALSPHGRDPHRPFRAPPPHSSQRGFERRTRQFPVMDTPEDRAEHSRAAHLSYQTTLTSPTIVSPPTPSTVFDEHSPSGFPVGIKGPTVHAANGSHFEPDLKMPMPDTRRHVREPGADDARKAGPEVALMQKAREEGRDTLYSDLFEGRVSVTSRREGTPYSDNSSVLIPRGTSSEALSSMAKKAQNRPTNPSRVDIPLMLPTRPTVPRSPSEEEENSLHGDELNIPLHKPLSRMEKAILRRVEFGQNIDFSKIQLS